MNADAAARVVRLLAEADPITENDRWTWCVLCLRPRSGGKIEHRPDCPWRLARELL